MGPFFVASSKLSHGSIGSGGEKRFSTLKPLEYGIPRKEFTPSFVNPRISPRLVLIIQSLFKLEILSSWVLNCNFFKWLILALLVLRGDLL